jgi:hypothetical protein
LKKNEHLDHAAKLLPCIGLGILCGFFTGIAIFLFRLGAKQAEELSRTFYQALRDEPRLTAAGLLILILAALMMALLQKKIPEAKALFVEAMENDRETYKKLNDILSQVHTQRMVESGKDEAEAANAASKKAQEDARYVLSNACDTRIIVTMNIRCSCCMWCSYSNPQQPYTH